ncbi:nicotinamide-nucleotide amidohydrolase family protein [Photobacterium kishitanii]|uniref:CinA C-terminal domain-containing protein n=1 Tax=Photobacterium kishitanii TaxID=318456 RepID=A0A2T3KM65_9GAMM|nr:nicotinamide-nucleotide amidohydrolase family protein [Photobacterium kishitanii]PSV00878.1 hypothetical protein C9J27_02295 [Photobacterium kishitanii]
MNSVVNRKISTGSLDEIDHLVLVEKIKTLLVGNGNRICCAESLTSGKLQDYFAYLSGSSQFFDGGVTAYSLKQKVDILSVDEDTASKCDCVSATTALEMAKGVAIMMGSDFGVSTTGYAESLNNSFAYVAVYGKKDGVENHIVCEVDLNKCGSRELAREYAAKAAVFVCHELISEMLYSKEHEYKFLLNPDWDGLDGFLKILNTAKPTSISVIVQAYLSSPEDKFSSRIRYKETRSVQKGFVTIKGSGNVELESEVDPSFARSAITFCGGKKTLFKLRANIPLGELVLELDLIRISSGVYFVLAEIEVPYEGYVLPILPEWIGTDVTGNDKFSNKSISLTVDNSDVSISSFILSKQELLNEFD